MKKIPDGIKLKGRILKFIDIHRAFSATKYGKKLGKCIRWERYKAKNITNAKWEKILGPDANNLKHLRITYDLTRKFISQSIYPPPPRRKRIPLQAKFNIREQEDLLLAAIIHDWGEAIVGDITVDLKTKAGENKEYDALKKIVKEIFEEKENRKILERAYKVIDEIISNRESKSGKAFNAVERMGYLVTCLRAWQKGKNSGGSIKNSLLWIVNNVLSGQMIKLIEYSKIYPGVAVYLRTHRRVINEAYKNLPDSIINNYKIKERNKKRKQLKLERESWNKFIA